MAPTVQQQLATSKQNRERYFMRVQQCFDLISKPNQTKQFLERCNKMEETYEKFEKTNESIADLNELLPSGETPLEVTKVVSAFDDLYYQIKAHESSLREEAALATNSARAETQTAPAPKEDKVRLPTIQIPIFDGQITEYPSWKSLYVELIHNSDLSDIQKFTYLRSYLSGPALATIDGIAFCSQNYSLAVRTLNDRYSKKRLLANHHFNTILNFQPLENDDVTGLRLFLDNFHIPVQSLKGLNVPDLDDFILLQLALKRMDPKTSREFETEQVTKDFPKFSDLVAFIKNKCAILDVLSETNGENSKKQIKNRNQAKSLVTSVEPTSKGSIMKKLPDKCFLCKNVFHKISACPKFLAMDSPKRFSVIKDKRMCFSCFSLDHGATGCLSIYRCRSCGSAAHHTLLHPNQAPMSHRGSGEKSPHSTFTQSPKNNSPGTSHTVLSGVTHTSRKLPKQQVVPTIADEEIGASTNVLLGTATIQVQNNFGGWLSVCCVIDPGSQISAISESLAQTLGLPRKKSTLQVSGIGSAGTIKSRGLVCCAVLPHENLAQGVEPLSIQAVILPTIASNITSQLPVKTLQQFAHLQLADLSYKNNQLSRSIDMLLGAEYYTSILVSSLPIVPGSPAAVPSRFGWLLMGRVSANTDESASGECTSLFISSLQDPIATQLQHFWELEEIPDQESIVDPMNSICENHFMETHSRDSSGRYIVKLPFKDGVHPNLESNRAIAYNRMNNLTRKLNKNPKIKQLYHENLDSYLNVGHMILAKQPSNYLLIHHGVYKESSTTPLRVVFDPNIAVGSGTSLSKALLVGPKLQTDIGDLLIQFRLNEVALMCDIKGMYRSIWLAEEDCKFQHILWYDQDKIVEYELKTVTFGLPPSPFLAQRVLKQLVCDEGIHHPTAAQVLNSDCYVDDIVSGTNSVSTAKVLQQELTNLLGRGGFLLRKWASSHPEVLEDVSDEWCEKPHNLGADESIKVLGLQWCPKLDSFCYSISVCQELSITKRKVLSIVASIYDINGFLSPVTVWLKIFLQQIWLHKDITWDSKLPSSLQAKWNSFISEAPLLDQIRISRHVSTQGAQSVELIGMADGSSVAYSAAIYLRVTNNSGVVCVNLLRAKTKVAPLKTITINRIELCGALLLARTLNSLSFLQSKLMINHIYLFSDSSTVLAWLKTQPHSLKTFVANRVVKILELTKNATWHHVSSGNNSADSASRGMLPSQFLEHSKLWFHGPEFLTSKVEEWPKSAIGVSEPIEELKNSQVLLTECKEKSYFMRVMEKYSSLSKLQAVIAWVNRFIYNARNPTNKLSGQLSIQESQQALIKCVHVCQSFYLQEDISSIQKGKLCSSGLRFLSPFLHPISGLLLVGGRLANAPVPENFKHPIVLPKCHLAILLIWHYHHLTLHGGPKIIQSLIQRRFWIVGGRNLIRHKLSTCVVCIRGRPKLPQPYMADLPKSRFAQGRPFINTGVDYAGPFLFKTGFRRNSSTDKCYLALFVCLATKCVHLELVSSLSTPAFLAALDRFVGRRGLPEKIMSDNGTNFKGASSHLQCVQQFLRKNNEEIENHLKKQEIKWCFIPPSAPNFGGLWEAGVKSTKNHLKHVLNGQLFNFEELATLLIRIEAILNSRPLCALNTDPNDGVDCLTPGHFLTGAPLVARPEYDVSEENISHITRWKRIAHASQCFWKRWATDYLNTLMQRTKGLNTTENIQCGDIVLVANELLSSQKWPLARVIETFPGKDGIIRVVKVKTASGEMIRPVTKLLVLSRDISPSHA